MAEPNVKSETALPHGAHKIDLGGIVLTFLHDKIILSPKGSEEHWTIHLGPDSKILDIHRTRTAIGGGKEYETLIAVPHERLGALFEEVGDGFVHGLRSLCRPLRIGWMFRNRIGAEPEFFPDHSEFVQISEKRKGRLYLNEAKFTERTGKIEYLEELFELKLGRPFALFSYRRRSRSPKFIGFGIRTEDRHSKPRLIWCTNKGLFKLLKSTFRRHELCLEGSRDSASI